MGEWPRLIIQQSTADELLDRELFLCLDEARFVLEDWRMEYNHERPHSGINWQIAVAYVAICKDTTLEGYSAATHAEPPAGATPHPPDQHANHQPSILS